jgi:long-chain acyl-CoA synthetase
MTTSKYINQVCVVGDKRKYLSAVVALDEENIRDYADSHQIVYKTISDLVEHPDIKALIDSEVKKRNQGLPSFETLKRVTIVPEFTIENAMMTPTFKLKKNIILKNYEDDIETMYG